MDRKWVVISRALEIYVTEISANCTKVRSQKPQLSRTQVLDVALAHKIKGKVTADEKFGIKFSCSAVLFKLKECKISLSIWQGEIACMNRP